MDGLNYEGSDYTVSNIMTDCFTCADVNTDCEIYLYNFLEIKNMSKDTTLAVLNGNDYWSSYTVYDELLSYCQTMCEGGKDAEECSVDDPCTPGSHFCDYKSDDSFALNISGTCKACPSDLDRCYEDGFVTSSQYDPVTNTSHQSKDKP